LPAFSAIRAADVVPAIDAILAVWRGEAPPKECVVNPEVLARR